MKRIRVFPSAIQIVTFKRGFEKRNHGHRVFFPRNLNLRWKHNFEASPLQLIQHCTFAYAVWMNRIHAAGKGLPLVNAATIILQEWADLISELIKSNLEAIPSQREEIDIYASASRKDLKTTLLFRRNSHAESLTDKMPAAFAALKATP